MLRVTLGKNTKGNQRRLEIGLGGYPTVTLQQAQSKAREMREKFRQGIDPRAERKAARNALIASQARGITFKEATHRCIEAKASAWKNAKHRQQWENTLDRYAFPTIGDIQIKDIDTPHGAFLGREESGAQLTAHAT